MNVFTKIAICTAVASIAVSTTFAKEPTQENTRPGIFKKIFSVKTPVTMGSCVLATINGTTLTCTREGTTYTIVTDEKTQFRQRFWGKSSLVEFSVNDTLNVIGFWTDDTHGAIRAKFIRNISMEKRIGVFFGKVKKLTTDGWVMNAKKHGDQTVTVNADTKFVNRKEESMSKADVVVENEVRVKGLWDKELNTVTEVKVVKNFDLP